MARVRTGQMLVLLLLFALVAGCLDLEQTVKISADGSGVISMTVTPGAGIPISAFKNQRFLAVTKGKHQVKAVVRAGKFQQREFVEFGDLREVSFKDEVISLQVQKQDLIGFRTSRGTFEHTMIPEKEQRDAAFAQGMASLLAGHTFTYRVELPGPIQRAEVVKIGIVDVEPTVQGSTATWIIPLELLAEPQLQTLSFKADFTGDVAFPMDRLHTAVHEEVRMAQEPLSLQGTIDNHYTRGVAGAPVVVKEFSDYTSPHSKALQEPLERALTRFEGNVQQVLYPFVLNPTSEVATQAALCAGEQGKFWAFHRMLYDRQAQWRLLSHPLPRLLEFAKELDVKITALRECVQSGRMIQLIEADKAYGRSLQVWSTPTIFVNTQRIIGSKSEAEIFQAIQRELGDSKKTLLDRDADVNATEKENAEIARLLKEAGVRQSREIKRPFRPDTGGLQNIVRHEPTNAEARYKLGMTYVRLKQYHMAVVEFETALAIQPNFREAHYNLGICYEFYLPDVAKAVAHYSAFLALGGKDARVEQLIQYREGRADTPPESQTPDQERTAYQPEERLEVLDAPRLTRPSTLPSSAIKPSSMAPRQAIFESPPRFVYQPKPSYPRRARKRGWEGKVLLDIELLADGTVGDIKVAKSSGYPLLDTVALQAVKKWRHIPVQRNGVAVTRRAHVPILFRLD